MNLRAEKKVLDYLKKDFDNLSIQISDEDPKYIYYSFNEPELLIQDDIISEPEYETRENYHPIFQAVAKRKFAQIRTLVDNCDIDEISKENLYFMIVYIKAGIDIYREGKLMDYVHSANIANYITTKRLTKGGLDDIQIIIKSKTHGEAVFNNLNWSGPLLKNILAGISSSLPGLNSNPELIDILNNPNTSDQKLKSLERKYKSYVEEPRNYLILKAASILITYLNDNKLLYNKRAKLGSKDQLELIYDTFDTLGLVKSKLEIEGDHVKRFREKIRDTLYKN